MMDTNDMVKNILTSNAEYDPKDATHHEGVTLRDHFAGHSPFTIKDAEDYMKHKKKKLNATDHEVLALLAEMNYQYADAMIAERNKEQE